MRVLTKKTDLRKAPLMYYPFEGDKTNKGIFTPHINADNFSTSEDKAYTGSSSLHISDGPDGTFLSYRCNANFLKDPLQIFYYINIETFPSGDPSDWLNWSVHIATYKRNATGDQILAIGVNSEGKLGVSWDTLTDIGDTVLNLNTWYSIYIDILHDSIKVYLDGNLECEISPAYTPETRDFNYITIGSYKKGYYLDSLRIENNV